MLYSTFKCGDKEYKLRLTAQSIVEVEKQLGKSVLDVLLAMAPEDMSKMSVKSISLPLMQDVVTILHGALQKFQHGITMNDTYGIYDEYIETGGSYMDFFNVLQGVLKVSGFLPKEVEANPAAAQKENSPAA